MAVVKNNKILSKVQALKLFALVVWGLLVAAVGGAIFHQDKFFAINMKPIAHLEKKLGSVVTRPEGVMRWRDLGLNEGLYDGDVVATGDNGRVIIKLGNSPLSLAENTQVKITGISSSSQDFSFVIRLVKGTASAEVANGCKNCGPIIFRAGDETFRVTAGKKLGLAKEAGLKPARRVDPIISDWTSVPVPNTAKVAVIDARFIEKAPPPPPPPPSPPVEEEKPVPPPVKVLRRPPPPPPAPAQVPAATPAMEAVVTAPVEGTEYWTVDPVASLRTQRLAYPLTLPKVRPSQGEWMPLFEVTDATAQQTRTLPKDSASESTLSVGLDTALDMATISMRGGLKLFTFGVRGGAEVVRGKERSKSVSGKVITTKVYSLAEVPDGPISIGLDGLNPQAANPSTHWLRHKQEISVGDAPLAIHLSSNVDYPKFLPFIRGAQRIGLSLQGPKNQPGLFVVRNHAVVAQISGVGVDKRVLDQIMKILRADLIFKGSKTDLHMVQGTGAAAVSESVGSLLDRGKVIYLLKLNKLFPVSREFIKSNNEVASFVGSQGAMIFLNKVEIVNYH